MEARGLEVGVGIFLLVLFAVTLGFVLYHWWRARSRQRHVRFAVDTLPFSLAYLDAQERYVFVNQAFLFLADGRGSHNFLGLTVREVWGDPVYARVQPYLKRALAGETVHFEENFHIPSGDHILQVSLIPHFDQHTRVTGVAAFAVDRSDYHAHLRAMQDSDERLRVASSQLVRNEERLNLALQSAQMFAWEWNSTTDKVIRSDNAQDILGLTTQPRAAFLALIHPDDRGLIAAATQQALVLGSEYRCEFRMFRPKTGELMWAEERGRPIVSEPDGTLILSGVFTDVTQRKKIEEDLRAAKKSAEDASRAKTAFLAHMSHEIRTPLGVIQGFTDLAMESNNAAEVGEFLKTIRRNTTRLSVLVDEVLDLSRIEVNGLELNVSKFHLRDAFEVIQMSLAGQLREKKMNLKIDWRAPEDLTLQSDPARVRQVLMSIIDNAIKFSDKGGEVRLQVDLHSAPVAANSQVSILVEDNGLGMTPEQQDRLFQPFVQGDSSMSRRYGGTGLGLILSQKIARTLGGDVALLRSTVGLGSAFLITFPLAVERKESPTSSHSGASGQSGHNLQGVQILLVEDSLDNQALIRRFLEMEGAIVECANHGEEGLRFALAHPFDVILLDIQMPVLDGYETIRQLRAHNYNRPVIALTAHAMQGERDRCLALGFTSYVTKPISRARLVETLKPYSLAEKQAPGPVQNVHISSPSAV